MQILVDSDRLAALSFEQQTLALFAGLGTVLVVASVVGAVLKARVSPGEPHAVLDNLNARIRAWWGMVIVVGVALLFGAAGVVVLFALLSFLALREFLTITYTRRGDHWTLLVSFFVVLPVQYWFVWTGWYGMVAIFIPVYAFLLLPILSASPATLPAFWSGRRRSSGGS